MRSKRRCVLERKQPYSGDEWCSGAETEEEDEKPLSATHRKYTHTYKYITHLASPVRKQCVRRPTVSFFLGIVYTKVESQHV